MEVAHASMTAKVIQVMYFVLNSWNAAEKNVFASTGEEIANPLRQDGPIFAKCELANP